MRVILDTNVVVSGIFFGGVPGRIVAAWSTGAFSLVISPDILAEYQRVGGDFARQYPKLLAAWEVVLALFPMSATIVDAPALDESVGNDPADEMFLAAALASRAHVIVSGDSDLLEVSGWKGITVCTPRQFDDQFLRHR